MCKVMVYNPDGNDGKGATFFVIAHIAGLNSGSARYNPNMTDTERNSSENLILLCPTDHNKIDGDPIYYTVEYLKKIKRDHINWVNEKLAIEGSKVTFAELKVIVEFLVNDEAYLKKDNLDLLAIDKKISKNQLSKDVRNLITRGLVQVKQVKDYIAIHPDLDFGRRLRNGFIQEYNDLYKMGLREDKLFYALYSYAINGNYGNLLYMAGGLSVLVYFFESCEVFEK